MTKELAKSGRDIGIELNPVEIAFLVALYDRMGSSPVKAAYMYGRFWDDVAESTYASLENRGLVEATPIEQGSKFYPGVDIALTDAGMLVAHRVQDGYDRRKVKKLAGFASLPAPEPPEPPQLEGTPPPFYDIPQLPHFDIEGEGAIACAISLTDSSIELRYYKAEEILHAPDAVQEVPQEVPARRRQPIVRRLLLRLRRALRGSGK